MADWTCPRCRRSFAARNARHSCNSQPPDGLFAQYPHALPLYKAVRKMVESLGSVETEATKTQVAFRARRRFAFLWIPQMALKGGAPDLYLTFDLERRVSSPRIKQSVSPRPGLWTHHMLLTEKGQLDPEVRAWLREALECASVERKRASQA